MSADRAHDVVLFGATGFTGGLTASYLAANAPAGVRWALAGRNRGKLEALRERLAQVNPACAELELLHADVEDAASLNEIAASATVVATTVGPYINYGEPLVAACSEQGTGYVDITGEPEFVDNMYVRHHARAAETGARLVHCCGFDSIPADLGAWFTVNQLPEAQPLKVECFVRAGGRPSGGTYQTAVTAFSRFRQMSKAHSERRKLEPRPQGRKVSLVKSRPHRESEVGAWAVPVPVIDPQIVRASAEALDRYGPDFSYGHYFAVKRLPTVLGAGAGLGALGMAAQVPPLRSWLLGRIASGDGPSPEQRAKSWFKARFIGEAGDGSRVVTEVSGGDPGYDETAKMLSHSALSLALDDNPECSGQVTTAIAMGDRLLARLQDAGIAFEVLERG